MKIFADTSNLEELKKLKSLGIIDGATTNPTLLSKEIKRLHPDFKAKDKKELFEKGKEILREVCEIVDGPVSAEVLATDAEGMVREGKELAKLHKHIVIKIPFGEEGLKATRELSGEGINVNMTLIFSPSQGLLSAKAGARYISPFIGRLDDISNDGMEVIRVLTEVFSIYDFDTELLVASVRHPMHVVEAALLGADIVTVPPAVLEKMLKHPLTDIGLKRFLSDWESLIEK